MRVIVFGVGAIGGTIAVALSRAGTEVIGIARGQQLKAIQDHGLRLRAPNVDEVARFDCFGSLDDVTLRQDDMILLTTKTQDTLGALEALQAAGVTDQPIFCLQNGVTNERMALRRFANVHAVTVMMPASFTKPGEVAIFCEPTFGILDIGRYPGGTDADDERLAKVLTNANFAAFAAPDVMANKYGKLLINIENILQAALGRGEDTDQIVALLRQEAAAAYDAAGIEWRNIGSKDPRRPKYLNFAGIEGVPRVGGSSAQSLLRGAGSIETDYLNGEIVLLGRLHGVPTPANAYMCALAARLVRDGARPGDVTVAQIHADLGL